MIFSVIPLLALYVFLRVVWPNCGIRGRAFFAVLLILAAAFPSYVDYFGGGIVSPTLGFVPMIVGEVLLISLLQGAVFFLIRDALIVAGWILLRRKTFLSSGKVVAGLFGFSLIVTLYAFIHALADPVVHRFTVEVENLPEELSGMTIAQLSDLHQANVFGPERLERIVQKTNALRSELIVITGDFADATTEKRGHELDALKKLSAPLGVYGCEGNHEYYADYEGWKRVIPTLGVRMLKNEHDVLYRNGRAFLIFGLTDRAAFRFPGRERPDPEKALKGAPAGLFTLALVHQPLLSKMALRAGADLMLSGHTHGGQTYLWSLVVAFFNKGYVRGLYDLEREDSHKMQMYVHSGTGFWTGFIERIGTDNEIALITLKRAEKH